MKVRSINVMDFPLWFTAVDSGIDIGLMSLGFRMWFSGFVWEERNFVSRFCSLRIRLW